MRDDWRTAAIEGDAATIERLLADGVDIDSRDRYGQTALMLAALHGREEVVCLLADRGADKNVTAKYGLSALMLAVLNRHRGVAEYLVDSGADTGLRGTGAPGFAGKTAYDLAQDGGLTAVADHIARTDRERDGD